MNRKTLSMTIAGLLIATGVLHLVVAATGAPADIRTPIAVFGALFGAIGLWGLKGGRTPVIAALGASTLGLALGGSNYLQNGGPVTLPVMFVIDIIVVICAILWLTRKTAT